MKKNLRECMKEWKYKIKFLSFNVKESIFQEACTGNSSTIPIFILNNFQQMLIQFFKKVWKNPFLDHFKPFLGRIVQIRIFFQNQAVSAFH